MNELEVGRHKIGSIAVDSGQMMLCDPCYIRSSWKDEGKCDDETIARMQEIGEFEFSYDGAVAATLSPAQAGVMNISGAVCSTGYGDGLYDVFIEVVQAGAWGKRIAKMEIVFIE